MESSSRVQSQGRYLGRGVAALVVATIALLCIVGIMDATRRGLDAVGTLAAATQSSRLSELDARYLAEVVRALDVVPGTKDYARLETMYVADRFCGTTVEMKTTFLAPAKMGTCDGEAKIIKVGNTLAFLEAKLWGADGEVAIHATATVSVK